MFPPRFEVVHLLNMTQNNAQVVQLFAISGKFGGEAQILSCVPLGNQEWIAPLAALNAPCRGAC